MSTSLLSLRSHLPYADNAEYLAAQLRRLDLLIQLRLTAMRHDADATPRAANPVYVGREEVDWLLSTDESTPPADLGVVDQLTEEIDARVENSLADGVDLPLANLGRLLGLSSSDLMAVVICLAPELRAKYDRLYAFLQDDITRQRPSVDLVLRLLHPMEPDRWAGHTMLSPGAALLRKGVLRQVDDPQSPSGSSGLARLLTLDPGICGYILGDSTVDSRLTGHARLLPVPDRLPVSATAADLARLAGHHRPFVCHLTGTGTQDLAQQVGAALHLPLLTVDAAHLAASPDGAELLRLAFRAALCHQAAVYVAEVDAVPRPDGMALRAALAGAVADFGRLVLLAGRTVWRPDVLLGDTTVHPVAVPAPDGRHSIAVWRAALADHPDFPPAWATGLADRYRLPFDRASAALAHAENRRLLGSGPPTVADAFTACRQQFRQELGDLAVHVPARAGWPDLVLPDDRVARLRQICGQVRQHRRVHDEWGFGGPPGLAVLFSGQPGTGKTMAAEVLAGELERDLYKVDLSGVVSKYIGETEKNLARVFAAARDGDAILFFDEADALFGKRTEVADAHDRYANIETSYLLQRMEQHDGLVVLATNLRQNMDDAFTRRLRFAVEFPFPDERSRLRIWRTRLPAQAPLADDVDLADLARVLPVTGASIRNIALTAAFLAADAGERIGRRHLLSGARLEFEKLGKLWAEPQAEVRG